MTPRAVGHKTAKVTSKTPGAPIKTAQQTVEQGIQKRKRELAEREVKRKLKAKQKEDRIARAKRAWIEGKKKRKAQLA